MRWVGIAWAVVLCVILSVHLVPPVPVDNSRSTPSDPPAEVNEALSESEADERSNSKERKDALFASTRAIETTSHVPRQSSYSGLAPAARLDDPPGLRAHGLRAPPS